MSYTDRNNRGVFKMKTTTKRFLELNKLSNIEISNIDMGDSPDFVDAFISYAEYKGRSLTNQELDDLNDNHSDFVYECVLNTLY